MEVLSSQVRTDTPEFQQNRERMSALVAELHERLARTREGGGPKYLERHRQQGKLPVRERISQVLDANTPFLELSPLAAWDLDALSEVYSTFIDETRPLLEEALAGLVTPQHALIARTRLMDTYRRFPGIDPGLPSERMPPGWPRDEARSLFTQAYNALGPLAETRVKQIMALHDEDAAAQARFQSSQEDPKKKAQSFMESIAVPGNSPLTKAAVLSAGAGLSVAAISNEL